MNWFLPSNFYLAFFFLTEFNTTLQQAPQVGVVLNLMYVFMTVTQIVLGLGNTPDEMKQMYLFSALFYGIFAYMVVGLSLSYILDPQVNNIQGLSENTASHIVVDIAAGASLGCFFVAGLFHGELSSIAGSFAQYMFMLPTFTNIFATYSFCNIHDISWGTKGVTEEEEKAVSGGGSAKKWGEAEEDNLDDEQRAANARQARLELERRQREEQNAASDKRVVEKEFKSFRSSLLLSWILTNCLFTYLVVSSTGNRAGYITFLFMTVIVFIGIRFIGSMYFILDRWMWLGCVHWFLHYFPTISPLFTPDCLPDYLPPHYSHNTPISPPPHFPPRLLPPRMHCSFFLSFFLSTYLFLFVPLLLLPFSDIALWSRRSKSSRSAPCRRCVQHTASSNAMRHWQPRNPGEAAWWVSRAQRSPGPGVAAGGGAVDRTQAKRTHSGQRSKISLSRWLHVACALPPPSGRIPK
jgi:hypothetical protein